MQEADGTITESTGLPAEAAIAAETPPPSQEDMLAELNAAEKEGRKVNAEKFAEKEQKLKEKHGEGYKPPEERKPQTPPAKPVDHAKAARETALFSKISQMARQFAELQKELKNLPETPESQGQRLKAEIAMQNVSERYQESVEQYKQVLREDLQSKYNADENFRKQHDYYEPMINELEGAEEFNTAILNNPRRVEILEKLYEWLDGDPAHLEAFAYATHEQRMNALKGFVATIKYKPRVAPAPPPAQTQTPQAPSFNVKPSPAGAGGAAGLDLENSQEDCLRHVLEMEKKMKR
jgi:uncharacterized protein YaaR (DUF327 family)